MKTLIQIQMQFIYLVDTLSYMPISSPIIEISLIVCVLPLAKIHLSLGSVAVIWFWVTTLSIKVETDMKWWVFCHSPPHLKTKNSLLATEPQPQSAKRHLGQLAQGFGVTNFIMLLSFQTKAKTCSK